MKYFFVILSLSLLMFPFFASAQNCNTLRTQIGDNTGKICDLIVDIGFILYVLGITLAIVIVIIGGIMYMTAGSDESKVEKGKKTITYGLIGLAVILLAGFIINLLKEIVINSLAS